MFAKIFSTRTLGLGQRKINRDISVQGKKNGDRTAVSKLTVPEININFCLF